MPKTTPVVGLMIATVVVPEFHEPPIIALLSVVVLPLHTVVAPSIAGGKAFTVTVTTR